MATNDLVTLTETKQSLRLTTTNESDSLLTAWITAVSTRVDELCGPVVARTVTDELHDGGYWWIAPKLAPVYSVTTLTEYDTSGTSRSLTAEDYDTKPTDGYLVDGDLIRRRGSGGDALFEPGRRNVRLTYQAGRVANTAAVPEQIKRGVLMILAHMWREEHGTPTGQFADDGGIVVVGAGWAIPRRARDLLGEYLRVPVRIA